MTGGDNPGSRRPQGAGITGPSPAVTIAGIMRPDVLRDVRPKHHRGVGA